jgi:hypothetical protein
MVPGAVRVGARQSPVMVRYTHAEAVVTRGVGKHHHRRARETRLEDAERTGGAGEWPLAHEHARPAGQLAVGLRHYRCDLLAAREHDAEAVAHLVELVQRPGDAQAR